MTDDRGVVWLLLTGNLGVLKGQFKLRHTLPFGEGEGGLTHPVVAFDVGGVVLEHTLTLVNHLVVVFLVQLAHRQVGTTGHLSVLALLSLGQV